MKNIFKPNMNIKRDRYTDDKLSRSVFSEQLKILQTKLDQVSKGKECRKIAITSSIPDEGKTMLAANLSFQLARGGGGRKVLLLDADIRKPSVTDFFNIKPVPGIAEYLTGKARIEDIVQTAGSGNFHVIPGGKYENSPDLLISEKFEKFLEIIGEKYNYVIIDTPPVIPVADAVYIKKYVDGVIFVYRLDFTPYDMLSKAIEEIGSESIIGVALNFLKYNKENKNILYKYGNSYYNLHDKSHFTPLLITDNNTRA